MPDWYVHAPLCMLISMHSPTFINVYCINVRAFIPNWECTQLGNLLNVLQFRCADPLISAGFIKEVTYVVLSSSSCHVPLHLLTVSASSLAGDIVSIYVNLLLWCYCDLVYLLTVLTCFLCIVSHLLSQDSLG